MIVCWTASATSIFACLVTSLTIGTIIFSSFTRAFAIAKTIRPLVATLMIAVSKVSQRPSSFIMNVCTERVASSVILKQMQSYGHPRCFPLSRLGNLFILARYACLAC